MNWRKSIARVLATTLLLSALLPAFAAPVKGDPPPPPPIKGNDCGRTGSAGSTPLCPPPLPSNPIIIIVPIGGWVIGK